MTTRAGRRAEWWFGKRTTLAPGTEAGVDAKGRSGMVSRTHRWFSYDWWFGSSNGPGHFQERANDGTFGDEDGRARRSSFGKPTQLGQRAGRGETPAARKRRETQAYATYCHERYSAAESATRGYMVTPAAKAKGITGGDFFDPDARRRPSMKWASDELRAWFGHGSAAAGDKGARGGLLSASAFREQTRERAAA